MSRRGPGLRLKVRRSGGRLLVVAGGGLVKRAAMAVVRAERSVMGYT